ELGLPGWAGGLATGAFVLLAASVALFVLLPNWKAGRRPPLTFLLPWIAFAVWWFPPLVQPEFTALLAPLFHGLQYLPFVYRMERVGIESAHPESAQLRFTLLILGLVTAGFLVF